MTLISLFLSRDLCRDQLGAEYFEIRTARGHFSAEADTEFPELSSYLIKKLTTLADLGSTAT